MLEGNGRRWIIPLAAEKRILSNKRFNWILFPLQSSNLFQVLSHSNSCGFFFSFKGDSYRKQMYIIHEETHWTNFFLILTPKAGLGGWRTHNSRPHFKHTFLIQTTAGSHCPTETQLMSHKVAFLEHSKWMLPLHLLPKSLSFLLLLVFSQGEKAIWRGRSCPSSKFFLIFLTVKRSYWDTWE